MAKSKKPHNSQKGHREFEITLPASATKSGKDETVKLGLRWEVQVAKPMTERGWTKWEMQCARERLERGTSAFSRGQSFVKDLEASLAHAVTAWCRTHLRGKGCSDLENELALMEKAPKTHILLVSKARTAMSELTYSSGMSADGIASIRTAVEILLDAAAHPPRNRRRFPSHLKAGRMPQKPRVKPGGWIDTGRYRPAQVLAVIEEPPHTMRLSYGDEVDEAFYPHINQWKTVRARKRLPSLKEVFSPGDQVHHTYFGCGRVLVVRDSTMNVSFDEGEVALAPDPMLQNLKKMKESEPERPFA